VSIDRDIATEGLGLERLAAIADQVEARRGWDFSRMHDRCDPVPWDYLEVVRRFLAPDMRVLDIATGGGERFLSLAPGFASGLGIDLDPEMVRVARENTPSALADRIRFEVMPAEALPLEGAQFDLVLNRHGPICPDEIVRLLKPGGLFITQQVGPRNTHEICRTFGCGVGGEYRDDPYTLELALPRFDELGCRRLAQGEYDVPYYFLDLESFVFWLKALPMPEDFSPQRHWQQVDEILRRGWGPQGLASNEHRQLLILRKPA